MKSDTKTFSNKNEDTTDRYDYLSNAASTQDCTGLIPANPLSQEAMEAYEDIYHYGFPKAQITEE